jgi:hypothetical protein
VKNISTFLKISEEEQTNVCNTPNDSLCGFNYL